jgi:hypothetical protein
MRIFKCKCGKFSTVRRDLADTHVLTAWDKSRHIIEGRFDLYSWIKEQCELTSLSELGLSQAEDGKMVIGKLYIKTNGEWHILYD